MISRNAIWNWITRSSRPEVFLRKGILNICSKFTGEHLCRSAILIKLQSNFIEIALRPGCSPVNLLHIFRPSFLKNSSGWLVLNHHYSKPITFNPEFEVAQWRQWHRSGFFIVNFEHISHLVLAFLLLTLSS